MYLESPVDKDGGLTNRMCRRMILARNVVIYRGDVPHRTKLGLLSTLILPEFLCGVETMTIKMVDDGELKPLKCGPINIF